MKNTDKAETGGEKLPRVRRFKHVIEIHKAVGEYLVLHPDGSITIHLKSTDAQNAAARFSKKGMGANDVVIDEIEWRIK